MHSGSCLSPRLRELLCGTPRTVLDEEHCEEDVLLAVLLEDHVAGALEVMFTVSM